MMEETKAKKPKKQDPAKDEALKSFVPLAKKKIYHEDLLKTGLLPWTSWKTTERRMKNDSFPGHWDGSRWYFKIDEVESWFKRINKAA